MNFSNVPASSDRNRNPVDPPGFIWPSVFFQVKLWSWVMESGLSLLSGFVRLNPSVCKPNITGTTTCQACWVRYLWSRARPSCRAVPAGWGSSSESRWWTWWCSGLHGLRAVRLLSNVCADRLSCSELLGVLVGWSLSCLIKQTVIPPVSFWGKTLFKQRQTSSAALCQLNTSCRQTESDRQHFVITPQPKAAAKGHDTSWSATYWVQVMHLVELLRHFNRFKANTRSGHVGTIGLKKFNVGTFLKKILTCV